MSSGNYKHELFAQFARIGKVLSNANRLEFIEYLAQGERSVESLAQISGQSIANTSQHLQQLRQAGLVTTRKDGQRVFYQLSGDDVVFLLNSLRAVAERHLTEVNHLVGLYLDTKDDLEPVLADDLLARVRSGEVTVLDVRPREEYAAGHLPGAINIPLSELETHLNDFNPGQTVVAYCRGPYCVLSYDAVAQLRKHGIKAKRLKDGYPEWKIAGLPVETQH